MQSLLAHYDRKSLKIWQWKKRSLKENIPNWLAASQFLGIGAEIVKVEVRKSFGKNLGKP
jgi:hypothetical protein